LQRSHEIACGAEAAIKQQFPRADVVVHVEPAEGSGEDILTAARRVAAAHDAAAHNLLVYEEAEHLVLELHLEMNADLPLFQGHRKVGEIDEELRRTIPRLTRVVTHIEPAGDARAASLATPQETSHILAALRSVSGFAEQQIAPEDIEIRRYGSEFSLSFCCSLPGETSIKEAHDFTEKIERSLRSQIPNLGRVMVRTEPAD
jgi:divalent metal cation (Fe/Co/Zn/Cd) transporter